MAEADSRLILPDQRSPSYLKWTSLLTERFAEALPFDGPINTSLTLGSGASGAIEHLGLMDTKEFTFADIGLPEGGNIHHPKKIIAGFTEDDQKIVAFTGRTAAFEIDPFGVETEVGHVEQMEAATAYLEVLNRIGTENVILTTAAGGINHPMFPDELTKPFERSALPVLGVIGADISWGYTMFHMGHHTAEIGDFFALKDSDPNLAGAFVESMYELDPNEPVPSIYYMSIPAVFEDPALAHFAAINNVQAQGMS